MSVSRDLMMTYSNDRVIGDRYFCGVLNCGGGVCVHRLTDELCPVCGCRLVSVSTTGVLFCSQHESVCDYETETDITDANR